MMPSMLLEHLQGVGKMQDVVGFYGHGLKMGELAVLSNFLRPEHVPIRFRNTFGFLCRRRRYQATPCEVRFADKAVMLCKVSAKGATAAYLAIAAATEPVVAKQFDR